LIISVNLAGINQTRDVLTDEKDVIWIEISFPEA